MDVKPYISLPQDQYPHPGAPAEWWWHVGTLYAGERKFGFEISVGGLSNSKTLMASIMVTDVETGIHYQRQSFFPWRDTWAQGVPGQPLNVQVGDSSNNSLITMTATAQDPLTMHVQAKCTDFESDIPIELALTLMQKREPLLVWGTGRSPEPVDPSGDGPLQRYNYYYSLTDLNATGIIVINGRRFDITGLTWMDHEFGAWKNSTKWTLQDCQFDNGIRLSNFTKPDSHLIVDTPSPSTVTVLWSDGKSTSEESSVTPLAPSFAGENNTIYFLRMRVDIPKLDASFTVTSLIANQEFYNPITAVGAVYEGVASAEGYFAGVQVKGTAWSEQQIA